MQREITEPKDLLDERGLLTVEGWSRHPMWRYDRSMVKARWWRIKEWDYYAILSQDGRFGVTLTLSDLGYAGLFSLCWLDFERGYCNQVDSIRPLTMGRTGLHAESDSGHVRFSDKTLTLDIETQPGQRIITFKSAGIRGGDGGRGLEGHLTLEQPTHLESINIATSWKENRQAFYYNRKLNCMPARGELRIGDRTHHFDPSHSFGTLDWGRGHWPYKNRWFWGSASGKFDGHDLGWNIGYGFSDRSPASENALFFDSKVHKLADVVFQFDPSNYMSPWHFTSNDGRFEMEFEPLVDRHSKVNLVVIQSMQHQVFGLFTGRITLDDGRVIELERFLGFAEDVMNLW